MTTYMLEARQSVSVAIGPLRIELASTSDLARLVVGVTGGAGKPIQPNRRIVALPPTVGEFVVDVVSEEGVFPSGAVASLRVTRGRTADDSEHQIETGRVDLGGAAERRLLTGSSAGGRWTVAASAHGSGRGLEGLADQACAAARAQLGVEELPSGRAMRMVVAVDGSASMVRLANADTLGAVIEVLLGIGVVVSRGPGVAVAVVDAVGPRWLPHQPDPARAAAWAVDTLRSGDSVVGVDLTATALADGGGAGAGPNHSCLIYTVTDGPLYPGARGPSQAVLWHTVVIADGLDAPADMGLPVTMFTSAGAGESLRDELQADSHLLGRLVGELLRSIPQPPATAETEEEGA
jgi:hypothetical protein